MESELKELIILLYQINAIKFEQVTLKTGVVSPVYVDLRVLVSYPKILRKIANLLWKQSTETGVGPFDVLCGVPYTALPFATAMSLTHDIPMVIRRKEAKSYGTKKMVEGVFNDGDTALVVEDVLTSGSSVLETATCLLQSKLKVTDAVILLDRNQGGIENLKEVGIRAHCLLDMDRVTSVLMEAGKIDEKVREKLTCWLQSNPSRIAKFVLNEHQLLSLGCKRMAFEQRSQLTSNRLTSRICSIISRKKSNLCVAIDFDSSEQVLRMASLLAPFICILKLHVDILTDFSVEHFVRPLEKLAREQDFVIFEDRKFADIGNTVRLQYDKGVHQVCRWAELVTAHIVPGSGVVSGLKAALQEKETRGCVLIAELSCKGQLLGKNAVEACFAAANQDPDYVVGFICQNRITNDSRFLHLTPGVASAVTTSDSLDQQYRTPTEAVSTGADVIIVGRSITCSPDPASEADRVRKEAFQAYMALTQL